MPVEEKAKCDNGHDVFLPPCPLCGQRRYYTERPNGLLCINPTCEGRLLKGVECRTCADLVSWRRFVFAEEVPPRRPPPRSSVLPKALGCAVVAALLAAGAGYGYVRYQGRIRDVVGKHIPQVQEKLGEIQEKLKPKQTVPPAAAPKTQPAAPTPPPPAPEPAKAEAPLPDPPKIGETVIVHLRNKTVVRGVLHARQARQITVRVSTGARLTLQPEHLTDRDRAVFFRSRPAK